jgi:hypothetical protein
MFNGKVVDAYKKGTVYAISISIPGKHDSISAEPYAVTQYPAGYYYQHVALKGNVMTYTSFDHSGAVTDEFVIRK